METKYGLPEEVLFCRRCVISNQRPNSVVEYEHVSTSTKSTIRFDEEGVCDACRFAEKKTTTDWDNRREELIDIAERYRSFDGPYNCLVPGSGGKDSFFQAHKLKYEFGFRPLTITWAPHIYTDWGRRNHDAWLSAGFDNILVTPNPLIHRFLTRCAVENLFHPFQPFIIGQKALATRIAMKWNIPLIFYGENEAEYGNPIADADIPLRSVEYANKERGEDVYLGGFSVRQLSDDFGIPRHELEFYMPNFRRPSDGPPPEVHYLGYYLQWHPQGAYYYAVENGGFEPSPERTPGTYSKYNSIDDKVDDLHYWTTWIKFGIGRASYDAAQEIRNGEIIREEGVALVQKYDGEWPERFEEELMAYLSVDPRLDPRAQDAFANPEMTVEYFWNLADKFRSPHLWTRDNGDWVLKHVVS